MPRRTTPFPDQFERAVLQRVRTLGPVSSQTIADVLGTTRIKVGDTLIVAEACGWVRKFGDPKTIWEAVNCDSWPWDAQDTELPYVGGTGSPNKA
jgi:hypothetical protein